MEFAKKSNIWIAIYLFLSIPFSIAATQYQSWLGNYLEFEARLEGEYQHFANLAIETNKKKYRSDNFFLNLSLSNAVAYNFALELELASAHTKFQKGTIDHLKVTGRYIWLDDIVGDALSLSTGISLIHPFTKSLNDISVINHGRAEAEFFCSIGKEKALETIWIQRWYGVAGIGLANEGSPWIRCDLVYESRWHEAHELRGFIHALCGLGAKSLQPNHFHGYGSIQHESLDVGIRYTYLIPYFGNISLQYSYRIYARNAPANVQALLAQCLYVFGL